ncbi:MAG: hypothetical protein SOW44_07940 [Porphyromonas sp.]|nr:hypothetical protein [Bacteroidales bacterium]MDY3101252.1 hypothetical protein [Porphyromonas sp.]
MKIKFNKGMEWISFPILSDDISISEVEDGSFTIEKQSTLQYFKVGYTVYYVITLIREGLCKQEILERCRQSRLQMSEEIYLNVLHSLSRNGIIVSDNILKKKKKAPIYFRVKLLSENLIDHITSRLEFLFRPYFLTTLFVLCSVCVLLFVVFTNKQIETSFYQQPLIKVVVLSLLILLFQIGHEIGHATASSKYGIRTKEIGVGFFYGFIPVFYSNLSRIWLLPANKRIIANMGGIYFDVLICSICIIAWYLTGIYFFLLYPYIILGVSLKNLNIFLRYDGYWIVADLLKSPNLLEESKSAVILLICNKTLLPNMSKKRSITLLIYGILSYIYVVFFIFFVLLVYFGEIVSFPKFICSLFASSSIDNILNQLATKGIWKIVFPLFFYIVLISKLVKVLKTKKCLLSFRK